MSMGRRSRHLEWRDRFRSGIRDAHTSTVAVIGGGRLARMMQESAVRSGINLRALVEADDGSTGQVTVDKVAGAR